MLNTLENVFKRKTASNHGVLIHTFFNKCDKINANGVLLFTVAGQQKAKPVIVTTANANPDFPDQKLTNFIRLNSMGQIPEECRIDFIITDENGKTELYDIYVFSYEVPMEELEADSPYLSYIDVRYREFLIQILNDRPHIDQIEQTSTLQNTIINFFEGGQINDPTIINNPLICKYGNYAIAKNIRYLINPTNKPQVEFCEDIVKIEESDVSTLEGKPFRHCTILTKNKNNFAPQKRTIYFSMPSGGIFYAQKIIFSILIRSNSALNLPIEIILNNLTILETGLSLNIKGTGNFEKLSIALEDKYLTSQNDEFAIALVLPKDKAIQISFTNIGIYKYTDLDISYQQITNSTPYPQFPSPIMQSPVGFVTMPMTVGRITEYLDDETPIEDKPSEIFADGRAVKRTDEYVYNKDYFFSVPIRIPYQYLYEKIGSRYGSGADFINVVDATKFGNNLTAFDIIFHSNAPMFSISKTFMIQPLVMPCFSAPILISRGYASSADYNIKTYFLHEGKNLYSLGISVDSGFCEASVHGSLKTDLYSQKKHQYGYCLPNTNNNDKANIYSLAKSSEKCFCVFGMQNLSPTLNIPSNATSAIKNASTLYICGSTIARPKNYNFISTDGGDDASNYSLRYCVDTITAQASATSAFAVYKKNTSASTVPSHAVISGHNLDLVAGDFLTKEQNIIPMKYQIAGEYAVGFKITDSSQTALRRAHFTITIKGSVYGCWINTGSDSSPFGANEISSFKDVIEIRVNDFTKQGLIDAICNTINSYIFCIPDLRGTFNFSTGVGLQSSASNNIGIDWTGDITTTLKPIITQDFVNFINFVPAINNCSLTKATLADETSSTATSTDYLPLSLDYQNFNNIPKVLTRKYISLC